MWGPWGLAFVEVGPRFPRIIFPVGNLGIFGETYNLYHPGNRVLYLLFVFLQNHRKFGVYPSFRPYAMKHFALNKWNSNHSDFATYYLQNSIQKGTSNFPVLSYQGWFPSVCNPYILSHDVNPFAWVHNLSYPIIPNNILISHYGDISILSHYVIHTFYPIIPNISPLKYAIFFDAVGPSKDPRIKLNFPGL